MKFTEEELEKLKKEKMEEIDRWLDNEYGCSYTRLEELHDFLIDRNMKFQDERDKYKNIIDELERYFEAKIKESDLKGCSFEQTYITGKWNAYKKSLNKLKELKGE